MLTGQLVIDIVTAFHPALFLSGLVVLIVLNVVVFKRYFYG